MKLQPIIDYKRAMPLCWDYCCCFFVLSVNHCASVEVVFYNFWKNIVFQVGFLLVFNALCSWLVALVISANFATIFRRWKFILLYSFPYSGRPIILDNNNNNEIIVFCFRVLNIYARKIYGKVGCMLKQKKTNMFKLLQLWCCWVCNYFHYYFCQLVSKKEQCREISNLCANNFGKAVIGLNIEKISLESFWLYDHGIKDI